ncbi:MAG: hypothetical protein ABI629_16965 [bacterium]
MKIRIADVTADAMALGVGVVAALDLLDVVGGMRPENISLRGLAQLQLTGWLVWAAFYGAKRVAVPLAAALTLVALLATWRRTRPVAVVLVSVAQGLGLAAVTAWLCATSYAFTAWSAVAAPLVALLPAWWLARRRHWSVTAMCIVGLGFLLGTVSAQLVWMVAVRAGNPTVGFLIPVGIAVALAWALARRAPMPARPFALRLVRMWGICTVCLCVAHVFAVEAYAWRPRAADANARRVVDAGAYDVFVFGAPPLAVWTDRQRIQVLENPYGDTHRRYSLDESATMVERIWPADDGGFYVQANRSVGWWRRPPDGQPIPYLPAAWIPLPAWILESASTVGTLVEDAVTQRLLLVGEWLSHYAAFERGNGAVLADGIIGHAAWSWWYGTTPPAARFAYMTSPFDPGLYTFDFDALQATLRAQNVYLYETVLDPTAHLLWGVRPMTGEVLAVDTQTFEVRTRIQLEPTLRDIKRDPLSGDLFACSFLSGEVYRIDPHTQTAASLGWCGRICRNLYFDPARRALWVASADGLCWIPTAADAR